MGRTRLLAVDSLDAAADLFAELGYTAGRRPVDLSEIPLPGVERAQLARSDWSTRRRGYGLLFGEMSRRPRSLRALAKRLLERAHDRPLGILGIAGENGSWERMVVFRPRPGTRGGGVSLTKLEIDLRHPTQHDARILSALTWTGATTGHEKAAQNAVDRALDVERVTRAFFDGLSLHFAALKEAVRRAADDDVAVAHQLKRYGDEGVDRVALRILTQVLFCEFLQRKGLIEHRSDWLSSAYKQKDGPYYATVLEPLFYDGLGTPRPNRRSGVPAVPYLNGGLFDRPYGPASLDLPDGVFDLDEGLLGYLDGWTFTVAEDMPDEAEVAVDPEMLGKVFEHLASAENVRSKGTVYTPRPVVHLMCREALVPWLEEAAALTEDHARLLLTEPDPFGTGSPLRDQLGTAGVEALADRLPAALDGLMVLDPAVGSGAFPLGMLGEIVRLKSLCHAALSGDEASADEVYGWKTQAIQHVLAGVDIEPRAIELCRLRLWLALVVDLPEGVEPEPLPNLEYRTVVADSLVDFVHGVEVQRSRGGFDFLADQSLAELHERWFAAAGTERDGLRTEIDEIEGREITKLLSNARAGARTATARQEVDELAAQFGSDDRCFPCFVPGLHAPVAAARGGWDVVIMNPPYVGRKEVKQRLSDQKRADLELHYGATNDLMIHFAYRALELVRPGGVVSMIFNDSIFTSTDAQELRRTWSLRSTVRSLARTKCFEGRAINGGVVVTVNAPDQRPGGGTRWIEGYKRDVADLAEASDSVPFGVAAGRCHVAGTVEVWNTPATEYRRLPHRPLYRPSAEALTLLDRFEACAGWSSTWSRWDADNRKGWTLLSNTRALQRHKEDLERTGFYERLQPGDWVLLGLLIEGGQGLATADDKRFLAAVDGTEEAERHRATQERLQELTLQHPEAGPRYQRLLPHRGVEGALLAVWDEYGTQLGWPKGATFRVAPSFAVRHRPLSDGEKRNGLEGPAVFVPFEKGDDSDDVGGRAIGAAWWRENPIVIDWSTEAVALLRERAGRRGRGQPRIQNEALWFQDGVTWNRVASYLRARQVPNTAIFSDKAPTIQPTVDWLDPLSLLTLLNAKVVDFILRTFLGSRMQIEIGDVRRIPVPVLDGSQAATLSALGEEAVTTKSTGEGRPVDTIEAEVNALVRKLYGIAPDAELWVVR